MTFDELIRLAGKEGWTIDEDEDGYCTICTNVEYPVDEEEDEDDDEEDTNAD